MSMDIDNMSVLDRRRIEAMVLGPMIRAFEQEIGRERAHAIARRVITKIAQDQGQALSQRLGGDDLATFSRGKDPWVRGGALEMDVLEDSGARVFFNVTRVPLRRDVSRDWHGRSGGHLLLRSRRRPVHRLQLSSQALPHPDNNGRRRPLRFPLHH